MKITERVHDLATGEIINTERTLTSDEIDAINTAKAELELNLAAADKAATDKAALLAKLGITQEEASLLIS